MNANASLTQSANSASVAEQIQTLVSNSYQKKAAFTREEALAELVTLYETAETDEIACDIRHAFLFLLKDEPHLLNQENFATFLAEEIEPEDFLDLEWEAVEHTLTFFDSLYSFRFNNHDVDDRMQAHLQNLLRHALHQFEQRGEKEKMFQLLRLAPAHIIMADADLRHLRYQGYAYEMHRVQRHRRALHIYLVIQAVFVLVVFPILFINAENRRLQRLVEDLTEVKLGDEGYQPLTYSEAVYWSIITASSIGYGDITPRTTTGRIIAATLGTIGVVTVGIFAGLVLDWLSPRRIE
jgi:hypothetical protein